MSDAPPNQPRRQTRHHHSAGRAFSIVTLSLFTITCAAAVYATMPSDVRSPAVPATAAANAINRVRQPQPLRFEANEGQVDPAVSYVARGRHLNVFLTSTGAVLSLDRGSAVEMHIVGAKTDARVTPSQRASGVTNYLIGRDQTKWRRSVPAYARVTYDEVYPGVDVMYYGADTGRLEYDFIVKPHHTADKIRLGFAGQRALHIDERGDLVLDTAAGEVRQHRPVVYQEAEDGSRRIVDGRYVKRGAREIGFEVGDYDRTRPLVIDPVLAYSTYLGAEGAETGNAIAVDLEGNIYVTGNTNSLNFPTAQPIQPQSNGGLFDAFVTKFSADGSTLLYSTYFGGSSTDEGKGIAVNLLGEAYVVGQTRSEDFPAVKAIQPTFGGGGADAFVLKLTNDGSAVAFATYVGGSGVDNGRRLAVDLRGNAYFIGETNSPNFPIVNAWQPTFAGGDFDAFVAELPPDGSALTYSTYVGGTGTEYGLGIAVDLRGTVYATGGTDSSDFPTVNARQVTYAGATDAFLTKIATDGTVPAYSSYLGGSGTEYGFGVAVDFFGAAYVAGQTTSPDFPTANALQPTLAALDAFVTKVAPDGRGLAYSTYLGGSGVDQAFDIATDLRGNAYVTGLTRSSDFPLVSPIQAAFGGSRSDVFVSSLTPDGSALNYSTYLGGTQTEQGDGIAVDLLGNAYVTGCTASPEFPTTGNAFQRQYSGAFCDVFVSKVAPAAARIGAPTPTPTPTTQPQP